MSEEKKSWDDIPSLGLQMDDGYDGEKVGPEGDRRHHRANLNSLKAILPGDISAINVRVATTDHGVFEGSIVDLSSSGTKLRLPKLIVKGELAKIGFILNKRTITANTITIWAKPVEDGCTVGLEFKGMTEETAAFIEDISSADILNKLG